MFWKRPNKVSALKLFRAAPEKTLPAPPHHDENSFQIAIHPSLEGGVYQPLLSCITLNREKERSAFG